MSVEIDQAYKRVAKALSDVRGAQSSLRFVRDTYALHDARADLHLAEKALKRAQDDLRRAITPVKKDVAT